MTKAVATKSPQKGDRKRKCINSSTAFHTRSTSRLHSLTVLIILENITNLIASTTLKTLNAVTALTTFMIIIGF